MGILDLLRGTDTAAVAELATEDPVAVASTETVVGRSIYRAEMVAENVALKIPAVRRAQAVIAGTISTFALAAWDGDQRLDDRDPRTSWLQQPDPRGTLQRLLFRTIRDGIWRDRCLWRITDRALSTGLPVKFERINPQRIGAIPDPLDDEDVAAWIVDSTEYPNPSPSLVHFDFAGLGGLRRYGWDLLDLYGRLQTAAGNYASAPHPKAILKNEGADLTDEEITDLLDEWEAARDSRSVGYLNSVVKYETYGWNAREMQLTEAREHAALEVARLFALPAPALNAPSGESMTYGNIVEYRRDILEALRPWMAVVTQTLSLDDRTRPGAPGLYLPRGVRAEFDADAYTRDAPGERMTMWATAIGAGVLTADEVRQREPLARGLGPAPTRPVPAAPLPAGTGATPREDPQP